MLEKPKHVIFDVDGTLYRKDREYNPKTGTIQTAHDFFRYNLHTLLKSGEEPIRCSMRLVSEYKARIADGTLKDAVISIPQTEKTELDQLVKQYKSNGNVFSQWHGLKNKGLPNLLHNMLPNIDFSATLAKDPKLTHMLETLKNKGYDLGIITSEAYGTVEAVADALGFQIEDFRIGKGSQHPELFSTADNRHYPILCRNNSRPKPDTDGFEKAIRILKPANPREISYVGDRIPNDITPALLCGMQAILVTGNDSGQRTANANEAGQEYTAIAQIYDLSSLL